jgi:hypothetical protein
MQLECRELPVTVQAFNGLSESPEARVFPSWNRRGGCALKKKTASEAAQTGCVSRNETFRNATPAAPFNGGFAAFS